jgi:Crinkler effector protein N-terminal domain
VHGDHSFRVKIEEDEDVAALKESIKEKAGQTFHDIDAKSLVVWAFSVPYNENLKENVELLDLDYDKSLKPLDSLSGIFFFFIENSIHVVVDRPPLGELSYATRAIKSSRFQQHFTRFHPNHRSLNSIVWFLATIPSVPSST